MPIEAHDEICRHLGELALRQIVQLEDENSDRSTPELKESLRSVWPEDMDVEIEEALRHELAAIERLSTFRIIRGDTES